MQITRENILDVQLRPWQQQLLEIIKVPTDREIIWVIGKKGNEGKTWFQQYLHTFYGYDRVVRLSLEMKKSNVLHILKKRPLSTTDIFLFNEPREVNYEILSYSVLESIKDGTAVSSKYDGNIITINTPNIVMVFSNDKPLWERLSTDRWKVFRIENNELVVARDNDKI